MSTDSGRKLQITFSGTDKPAVAVADKSLLLPTTIAANETPTGLSGVVTLANRIVGACASVAAASSDMYGPSRLTAQVTCSRVKVTPLLLKSYWFIAFTAREVPSMIPAGFELMAEAAANAEASAAFCNSLLTR